MDAPILARLVRSVTAINLSQFTEMHCAALKNKAFEATAGKRNDEAAGIVAVITEWIEVGREVPQISGENNTNGITAVQATESILRLWLREQRLL